jgi:hypothetical protein
MTVVTLLTKPDCPLCQHAKTVLARVRADHPLQIEEIRLDTPDGGAAGHRGRDDVRPGILLDGRPFGFGRLSERALRRALNRYPAT